MNKLNLILIGLGNMGKIHYKSISNNLLCNKPIVVDSNPSVVSNTNDIEFYQKLDEIPLDKFRSIDGAIVSSPSGLHFDHANFFIEKNIPVLVEKPLTDDADKTLDLINKAKSSKVLFKCGLIELYNPIIEELSNINFEDLKFVHFKRHSPPTEKERELENIILDLTLHDISAIMKIFKPDDIEIIGKELIYKHNIAESAQILLKLDNSFVVFLSTSRQDQEKLRLLEIVDEKASYYCDLKNKFYEIRKSGEITFSDSKSITESNILNKVDMLNKPETADIQLESFLKSIVDNELDEEHVKVVEKTHKLAYEILDL